MLNHAAHDVPSDMRKADPGCFGGGVHVDTNMSLKSRGNDCLTAEGTIEEAQEVPGATAGSWSHAGTCPPCSSAGKL